MSSLDRQDAKFVVADILATAHRNGVRLWLEGDRLRYSGPPGALAPEHLSDLRTHRNQIIILLQQANGVADERPDFARCAGLQRAPLAYTQQARLNLYRLNERRPMRTLGTTVRIKGRLNLDALRRSVGAVFERHDALRTRIVFNDDVATQEVGNVLEPGLRIDDLSALPTAARDAAASHLIDEFASEPIDLRAAPLVAVRLLKLSDNEHLFVVAMEHMISDMASIGIFVRELFALYTQAVKGEPLRLPPVVAQFPQYAAWQRGREQVWLEKHAAYWNRLISCQRLRFPEDHDLVRDAAAHPVWAVVTTQIDSAMLADLRKWCRSRRTTLVMSVFTAYVALVLRWCDTQQAVFQFQSDGRNPDLANTIGFFASALYLHGGPLADGRFADLLKSLEQAYSQATADSAYLAALLPAPDLTRSTMFNWIPLRSSIDVSDLEETCDAIVCDSAPFARLMSSDVEVDQEPSITLFAFDDRIDASIYFPAGRFEYAKMERFSRNLLRFVRALLAEPDRPMRTIPLE
ncbi:MAG TPA: condensation domain-containing protein [Povalibacter sp.]|nr:condensation domain-containing protein [Povalibacter sp.]